MAQPKRQTREQLEAELVKLRDEHSAEHRRRRAAEEQEKETRSQFADLKERLAFSEAEVQRMGGYISRVQEDDVVRDPLVQVGDPDGAQQLVPKRKATPFHDMKFVREGAMGCAGELDFRAGAVNAGERRRPRHWVTY